MKFIDVFVLWEAPHVGVLPAYGGRYSPTRPSCGVFSCLTEHPALRTDIAVTTLIQTFWLKSFRSHNGYGTPKDLSTAVSITSIVITIMVLPGLRPIGPHPPRIRPRCWWCRRRFRKLRHCWRCEHSYCRRCYLGRYSRPHRLYCWWCRGH